MTVVPQQSRSSNHHQTASSAGQFSPWLGIKCKSPCQLVGCEHHICKVLTPPFLGTEWPGTKTVGQIYKVQIISTINQQQLTILHHWVTESMDANEWCHNCMLDCLASSADLPLQEIYPPPVFRGYDASCGAHSLGPGLLHMALRHYA